MRGRALQIISAGELVLAARDWPAPVERELLIRVHASGLNRADLLQVRGLYPAPPGVPSDIPGLEYAGVVERAGPLVSAFKTGDQVMGLVAGGAHADYVCVDEREVAAMHVNDFPRCAAIPEAFITAFDALITQCELRAGETVLIHAVGSGVGTAALQIAVASGATALGTTRTAEKLQRALSLGLSAGWVLTADQFADEVKHATSGRGADVVLDLVGGSYARDNLDSLAYRGRWIVVGLVGGAVANVTLPLLLQKRARIVGTVLRSRPVEEKRAAASALTDRLVPLFRKGTLVPIVDEVFDADQYADAWKRLEDNRAFGKLVLRWV